MISKTDIEPFSDGQQLFVRDGDERPSEASSSFRAIEQASRAWLMAWATLWRLFTPPWLRLP